MGRRKAPPPKPKSSAKPPIDPDPAPAVPKPVAPLPGGHDRIAIVFFFALLLASATAMGVVFFAYFTDLVLGLLLTSVSAPVYLRLKKWLAGRSLIASLLTCLLIVVLVLGPVVMLTITLSKEAAALYATAKEAVTMPRLEGFLFGEGLVAQNAKRIAAAVGFDYSPETVKGALAGAVSGLAGFLYRQANALLSNLLSFFLHFFLTLMITFYLLIDGDRLKDYLLKLSPLPDDEDQMIGEKFRAVGRAILVGNGVSSGAQGALTGLSMYVLGLPSPVLWGTVVAILAFLPMVGSSLVVIPAAIYLFLEDRIVAAIIFLAFNLAQSFIIDNVIKTKMIGSQMRMHDLLIFLSVLGGIGLFGLIGILYGPLVVALFMVFLDLYEERYRRELLGS